MKSRIVNIVLVIILTFLAVIGLLYDFKNECGEITFWGNLSLFITIISGVVSVVIIILEDLEAKKENAKAEIELKIALLRDLHSPDNSTAINAVHKLRSLNKLTGENSWTRLADLGGKANLSNAVLYDANFEGAILHGANLYKADLRNVNFFNADLTGVNLYESNISTEKFNENTILPDGHQWNEEIDLSKYTNSIKWQETLNWLELIDLHTEPIDIQKLLEQESSIRNVMLYLKYRYPTSEIDIAEDDLHFLRHWRALKESGFQKIGDIHSLLKRTDKAMQWVWKDRKLPYLIVNISYSIALENPKHMSLTHWTKDTIDKVVAARKEFLNL